MGSKLKLQKVLVGEKSSRLKKSPLFQNPRPAAAASRGRRFSSLKTCLSPLPSLLSDISFSSSRFVPLPCVLQIALKNFLLSQIQWSCCRSERVEWCLLVVDMGYALLRLCLRFQVKVQDSVFLVWCSGCVYSLFRFGNPLIGVESG